MCPQNLLQVGRFFIFEAAVQIERLFFTQIDSFLWLNSPRWHGGLNWVNYNFIWLVHVDVAKRCSSSYQTTLVLWNTHATTKTPPKMTLNFQLLRRSTPFLLSSPTRQKERKYPRTLKITLIIDESALEKNNQDDYLPRNHKEREKKNCQYHCNKVKWRSNIENQLHVLHIRARLKCKLWNPTLYTNRNPLASSGNTKSTLQQEPHPMLINI